MSEALAVLVGLISFIILVVMWCLATAGGTDDEQ